MRSGCGGASLAVPIFDSRRLVGFIGFDLVGRERLWSDDHLGVLSSTAGIISQALSRRDAEQRFGMAFDRAPLGMALHSPRHIGGRGVGVGVGGRGERWVAAVRRESWLTHLIDWSRCRRQPRG